MPNPVLLRRTYQQWVKIYAVESDSRRGVHYNVAVTSGDVWGCTCPAWKYRREQHPECKHIAAVKRWIIAGKPGGPASERDRAFRERAEAALDGALSRASFIEL